MNMLILFGLSALLLSAVCADNLPSYGSDTSTGYGPAPSYGRGPGRGRGPGYGPGPGYGRGPFGRGGYNPFSFASVPQDKQPDDLDKIYFRLDRALNQIKIYSEMTKALAARLSLQKQFLDQGFLVDRVAGQETDERQDNLIEKLWSHLGDLFGDIKDLATHVDDLSELNHQNVKDQEKAEILWAKERRFDVKQEGEIASLFARVKDYKPKLFQVKANYFETFYDTVELATVRLGSIKARENRRMCETGRMTLKADDRRAEYSYQTWFDKPPQIIYGLCGFSINLDSADDSRSTGYGYGYNSYKPPESIGLFVIGYTTKTTLTLEGVEFSFGDSSTMTGDICFQACTIDPGTGPTRLPWDV